MKGNMMRVRVWTTLRNMNIYLEWVGLDITAHAHSR